MITVTIFRSNLTKEGLTYGFEIRGHAGQGDYGHDIVCAAVSVLYINTCNSLEMFTKSKFIAHSEESAEGYLDLFLNNPNEQEELLLKSLELGLNSIANDYGEFVKVVYKID